MDLDETSTANLLDMLVDPAERRRQTIGHYDDVCVLSDIIAELASRIDRAQARVSRLEAHGIAIPIP